MLRAQTPLSAGDIAFTGYVSRQAPAADTFSFMVLKSSGFDTGTEVYFTDNGWLPTGIGRAGGEGVLKWTATQHLRYGEQVRVVAGTSITVDKGSITRLSGSFDLATTGDQLFAYTGTWPSPDILVAGLHFFKTANTTAQGWDVGSVATGSSEFSVYPAALCSTCGVWVTDPAVTIQKITTAGYYKGGYNASAAALRAMINNNANWNNTFSLTSTAPTWRLPPLIELPAENTDTSVTEQPDTSAPRVIAVASTMPDGVYKAGDEINIVVYFNKNVIVNPTAGVPYLQLNVGKDSSRAVYVTGSCGSALTFLYTVKPGDTAVRLDYLSPAALKLNNGTIQNAMATAANVTLPSSGATLAAIRSLTINAVAPVVTPMQSFTADRFSNAGTIVGTLKGTARGPVGTTLQNWTIVQGNVSGAFAVNGATGELAVANESVLHDQAYAGFQLMVTVGDGSNTSAPEEVMVLLREVALDDTVRFAHDSLFENKPVGTLAGKLSLASGNAGAVYTLVAGAGDADNSLFSIGKDSLQTAALLDYEQQKEYHVRVRATMQNRYIDTSLVVKVYNLNEPPTIDAVANQTVCENAGYQTLPLTGITCGPEGEDECVTVAVSTNNPSLFAQLLVIRESDGTTVLRYKVKDSTAGQALVTVTVKDNGGTAHGGADSVTTSFTIIAKAAGKVTIVAGGSTALSENGAVTLTATVTDATGAMQWLRNGEIVADAHTASYKVDAAHTGAYNCTITSTEGCLITSNTIAVTQANVPVTLMTYPNPTAGKLFIVFTGYVDQYVYAIVRNNAGAELQKKRIWHSSETQKDELDLSGYAAGMYIIELISDKGDKMASANVLKN
ncbi:hypothetical protein FLA_1198 [Filimonas lacunae]|nr:hypothetical protein FLA_1198 [Filimonas lacunae]